MVDVCSNGGAGDAAGQVGRGDGIVQTHARAAVGPVPRVLPGRWMLGSPDVDPATVQKPGQAGPLVWREAGPLLHARRVADVELGWRDVDVADGPSDRCASK